MKLLCRLGVVEFFDRKRFDSEAAPGLMKRSLADSTRTSPEIMSPARMYWPILVLTLLGYMSLTQVTIVWLLRKKWI